MCTFTLKDLARMEEERYFLLGHETHWTYTHKLQDPTYWHDSIKSKYQHPSQLQFINNVKEEEEPTLIAIKRKDFDVRVSLEKTAVKKSVLKQFQHIHTGERPYSCCHCDFEGSYKCLLLNHIRTHAGDKPLSCTVCGKSFTRNIGLKHHQLLHVAFPHHCEKCGKMFEQKTSLESHHCMHTDDEPLKTLIPTNKDKLHRCEQCGKLFGSLDFLANHMRTPLHMKKIKCVKCNKRFTRKDNMIQHLRESCKIASTSRHNQHRIQQKQLKVHTKIEHVKTLSVGV